MFLARNGLSLPYLDQLARAADLPCHRLRSSLSHRFLAPTKDMPVSPIISRHFALTVQNVEFASVDFVMPPVVLATLKVLI